MAGWVAVAPLRWGALDVFVFLACWEIGGRNIVNDMSDLESDARVGIHRVASVHGEAAAARAAAAVAAACLLSTVALPMPLLSIALALAFGVCRSPGRRSTYFGGPLPRRRPRISTTAARTPTWCSSRRSSASPWPAL